jgi:hypothetical protein
MKQKCVDSLEHIEYVNIQKKYFKHVRHTNRVCRGAPDFSDEQGLLVINLDSLI